MLAGHAGCATTPSFGQFQLLIQQIGTVSIAYYISYLQGTVKQETEKFLQGQLDPAADCRAALSAAGKYAFVLFQGEEQYQAEQTAGDHFTRSHSQHKIGDG